MDFISKHVYVIFINKKKKKNYLIWNRSIVPSKAMQSAQKQQEHAQLMGNIGVRTGRESIRYCCKFKFSLLVAILSDD